MASRKRLINSLFVNMVLISVLTALLLGCFFIVNEINRFNDEMERYYAERLKARKELIKSEIDIVISDILFKKEQLEQSGSMDPETTKKEILKWIGTIRLRQNQYVVVNRFDGTILSHYKVNNIGKNMWDFADSNGFKAVQEAIKVSKAPDGGYISYVGSIRPSTGKPGNKVTYARSIPEWEWTVTTGIYLDDIEINMAHKRNQLKAHITDQVKKTVLLLLIIILGTFLAARFIAGRLRRNFGFLASFFKRAATHSEIIDHDQIHYSEFQALAISVNQMTGERHRINEKLHQHQHRLESLVKNRTRELEEANENLELENAQRRLAEEENEKRIAQLHEALSEVRTLQGMLPICSSCKKIRDDSGYWDQIESYIQKHSDATFTHGLCPACMDKTYGQQKWYKQWRNTNTDEP